MKVYIGKYPKNPLGERKVNVRIDPHDTFSAFVTLSHVIVPLLTKFRENLRGAPWVDDDDVPSGLKSSDAPPKVNEWDTDENWFKRWEWVLDEMIWAFGQTLIDWESQYGSGTIDFDFVPCDDGSGNSLMVEGPNHTYTVDKEGEAAHKARMNNGFRLFGKYYEGLWN